MKIGLFFGSFNPIHVGHLIIAEAMLDQSGFEEVQFVVSPQSPFKQGDDLLPEKDRLVMVQAAVEDNSKLYATDIEFNMPKPNYTADTLVYLRNEYPEDSFSLIIGSDNLAVFRKWKRFEEILENHEVYVYPRPGYPIIDFNDHPKVNIEKVPLLDISATYIRSLIKNGKPIKYLVHPNVEQLIKENNYYRNVN